MKASNQTSASFWDLRHHLRNMIPMSVSWLVNSTCMVDVLFEHSAWWNPMISMSMLGRREIVRNIEEPFRSFFAGFTTKWRICVKKIVASICFNKLSYHKISMCSGSSQNLLLHVLMERGSLRRSLDSMPRSERNG